MSGSSPPAKRVRRASGNATEEPAAGSGAAAGAGAGAWSPLSWQGLPILQQPEYKDAAKLSDVLENLGTLPPLVHAGEVDELKKYLAEAAEGQRFLLQGGDCAELFSYCNQTQIENKLKILLQMSLVLTWGARTPVVRVARMAGQYGKPRSKPTEVVDGKEIPSYRGDNVNGFAVNDREPDPNRLRDAYFHSAATLNYVRALVSGGFADLRKPQNWSMEHVICAQTRQSYEQFMSSLLDSIDFMHTVDAAKEKALGSADFFSSHEALLLNYEAALTRKVGTKWYNLGAHFLWIGDRTRQLDGAHVEFFRGLANPIGMKVGPTMKPSELVALVRKLNPDNEKGRITLITRFGAAKVDRFLPCLIEAIKVAALSVVWCCDPMHGNTVATKNGVKTRHFNDIVEELRKTFALHKAHGTHLGGVHFELTGDKVTECVGGSIELSEADLSKNYQTFCDPRLNYGQAMDMALLIAMKYQRERKSVNDL